MEGLQKLSRLIQEAKNRLNESQQSPVHEKKEKDDGRKNDERKKNIHKSTSIEKKLPDKVSKPIQRDKRHTSSNYQRDKVRTTPSDSRDDRTLFVGNIPNIVTKRQLIKLFSLHGKIESIRFRSAPVAPGKLPVKIARKLRKQLTGETINSYVVMATEDEAKKCLVLNGSILEGRHLRVDTATSTKDNQRSVFVGNLPFTTDEENLRKLFQSCGEVEGVRIIKDNRTGIGKGFGYILFKERSGVLFAVKHNQKMELDGRKLRIYRCKEEPKKIKLKTRYGGVKAESREKIKEKIKNIKMNRKMGESEFGDGFSSRWKDNERRGRVEDQLGREDDRIERTGGPRQGRTGMGSRRGSGGMRGGRGSGGMTMRGRGSGGMRERGSHGVRGGTRGRGTSGMRERGTSGMRGRGSHGVRGGTRGRGTSGMRERGTSGMRGRGSHGVRGGTRGRGTSGMRERGTSGMRGRGSHGVRGGTRGRGTSGMRGRGSRGVTMRGRGSGGMRGGTRGRGSRGVTMRGRGSGGMRGRTRRVSGGRGRTT